MIRKAGLDIPSAVIADLCRRYHIRRFSLFGSAARNDFAEDSDVDVLVEFHPAHVPGFIRLATIEEELSAVFHGRRVDMVTTKALNPRLRARVLKEAIVVYQEG